MTSVPPRRAAIDAIEARTAEFASLVAPAYVALGLEWGFVPPHGNNAHIPTAAEIADGLRERVARLRSGDASSRSGGLVAEVREVARGLWRARLAFEVEMVEVVARPFDAAPPARPSSPS